MYVEGREAAVEIKKRYLMLDAQGDTYILDLVGTLVEYMANVYGEIVDESSLLDRWSARGDFHLGPICTTQGIFDTTAIAYTVSLSISILALH